MDRATPVAPPANPSRPKRVSQNRDDPSTTLSRRAERTSRCASLRRTALRCLCDTTCYGRYALSCSSSTPTNLSAPDKIYKIHPRRNSASNPCAGRWPHLPRQRLRSSQRMHRGSSFQYFHYRLSGNLHRSFLRRPDRRSHQSPDRQLRHQPDDNEAVQALHRRPDRARVLEGHLELALGRGRRRLLQAQQHPGTRRHRHPRAGAPPARPRRHARRDLDFGNRYRESWSRKRKSIPKMDGTDLANVVTTTKLYTWDEGADRDRSKPAELAKPQAQCGRLRLRHQAQHPAHAGRRVLQRDRGPGADERRRCAGAEARRSLPVERPRRSRAGDVRAEEHPQA